MTTTSAAPAASARRQQSGPPLLLPAVAFAALMVVSIVLSRQTPLPTDSAADTLAYFRDHETAARVAGTLQFGASLPLAVWAAIVYQRLRRLGVSAPGPGIALVAGVLSAVSMATCGLTVWAASRAGGLGDAPLVRVLTDLLFATGGPGHVVPFGVMLAGVAVPMLLLGFGPKGFAWTGLVLAGIGVLGTLALLSTSLGFFLPIGRFGGLIWLIAASVILPKQRPRRTAGYEGDGVEA
ncbi:MULTISPECIES: DUF4386 domain-containing protein [unclassified Streptomyces]|uniref:DUF4386 domain-containing protein n=1 Tax=Streptomycetaceae TaxID=2062 RepID=UPI002E791181|nr:MULTISPECIES: DUF4386 domain-containing protein [unclassified Streptomyces]MED7951223.1 DUF4386 domain-containing protein [Streptomyces sp. BE303]MEE1826410.1 DUF4386 domain-containing protein [Streptomyces sp. BE20]